MWKSSFLFCVAALIIGIADHLYHQLRRTEAEFMNVQCLRTGGFVYNFYVTNLFQSTFAQGGGGGVKSVSRSELNVPVTSKNSASV
jgi:hypothetical protein